MAQPSTIAEAIDQNARGPASVSVAGQTVTAKDIGQLIEADRYLKNQAALSTSHMGLRFTQIKPPGCG